MLTIDEQLCVLNKRIENAPADDNEATTMQALILLGQLIAFYNTAQSKITLTIPIGPITTQDPKPKP